MSSSTNTSSHQRDMIAIEITPDSTQDGALQHVDFNISRSPRIATTYIQGLCHEWILPYVTQQWMKFYIGYIGLFWGLVVLLWHFDNSHGNMDTEITDPNDWYISNAFNAWTSIVYMIAVPFTHTTMKLPLVSLAVSSFCLWSDSGGICRFIDVTSIHWVIVSVMLQKTPSSRRYTTNHILNVVALVFMVYYVSCDTYRDILSFYGDHLTFTVGSVTAFNILITFNSHGPRPNLIVGCMTCLFGFWCKFRYLLHGDWWGTGVFHLLTAIGIAIVLLPTKQLNGNK